MQSAALGAPDSYVAHATFLYGYALSRTRERDTAEDLVQETLLAALEAHAPFKGGSKLRTWLTGILKHKIIDWYRSEARNPARTTPRAPDPDEATEDTCDALFDSAGRWVTPPSEWPTPDEALDRQRFWETLEQCLANLPATTARAFYLREIEGLSTHAICAQLGISESNCWVKLHRARMRLREMMEGQSRAY